MDEPWTWEALLQTESPPPRDPLEEAVEAVLDVEERLPPPQGEAGLRRWVGTLRLPSQEAMQQLTPRFRAQGVTALLQEAEGGRVRVVAMPGLFEPSGSRLWLALLLFALTVVSTILTGASEAAADCTFRLNLANGVMFGGTILAILLAHELGHFFAARRAGVAVSYPFFIPFPTLFGTMGAVIQMKEPPPNRGALFSIAVAGPLAGLVLALPLTLLGLALSEVTPIQSACGSLVLEGNSLLYAGMKWLIFGRWLPSGGDDVLLHPIAFAGWAGMLVTAMNLLPAGQLDGGHVLFGLLGRRWGQRITYGVVVLLGLLGFVWNGWWFWAVMIFFLARRHAPILDDVTPIDVRQRLLALLILLLFFLLFTPLPVTIIES